MPHRGANDSYRLHLDLHWVVGPLGEHGRGITLTRELELPFPAHDSLRLHSRRMDECSQPLGYELKDVTWDMDRGIFLARTYVIDPDLPLAALEDGLRRWLAMGWRLGSYLDAYPDPVAKGEADEGLGDGDDGDEYVLPTLPPRRRPAAFNRVLKALVQHMAEGFDRWDIAYAADQTGRYKPIQFTPTCVGTSRRRRRRPRARAVHPHVRGDIFTTRFHPRSASRFTPTCVGTS